MNLSFFLRGALIGFSVAAPVGPVGLLCIRRTLSKGKLSGFVSGMGAATADMVYSAVAAYGLSFISDFLTGHKNIFQAGGGVFLCVLGAKIFRSEPVKHAPSARKSGLRGDFLSTLVLTITNPMTVLAFMAIFAGLGLTASGGDRVAATALVVGVFLGSALWWFLLSEGVGAIHHMIDAATMRVFNRVSGSVIAAVGLIALVRLGT